MEKELVEIRRWITTIPKNHKAKRQNYLAQKGNQLLPENLNKHCQR